MILFSERDTISTLGSSEAIRDKSSRSLPHRLTFLMDESLSVLHLARSNSLVRAFAYDCIGEFLILLKVIFKYFNNLNNEQVEYQGDLRQHLALGDQFPGEPHRDHGRGVHGEAGRRGERHHQVGGGERALLAA